MQKSCKMQNSTQNSNSYNAHAFNGNFRFTRPHSDKYKYANAEQQLQHQPNNGVKSNDYDVSSNNVLAKQTRQQDNNEMDNFVQPAAKSGQSSR